MESKNNSLKLIFLLILLICSPLHLYTQETTKFNVFTVLEDSIEFQATVINDCTGNSWRYNCGSDIEFLKKKCIRSFVASISPKFKSEKDVLIFNSIHSAYCIGVNPDYRTPKTLNQAEDKAKSWFHEYPFKEVEPYEGYDFKELLSQNKVLILTDCILKTNEFKVLLIAVTKAEEENEVFRILIQYDFKLALLSNVCDIEDFASNLKFYREWYSTHPEDLIEEDGVVIDSIDLGWKLMDIDISEIEKYSVTQYTLRGIFHWGNE